MSHPTPLVAALLTLTLATVARAADTFTQPPAALLASADRVVYKRAPQEDLALFVLHPAGDRTTPRPAIVYFTGGGWKAGTPDGMVNNAAYFRDLGMVGIAADYRVEQRHHTTPVECVTDGRSALRYVRRHAAELGVDPHRVVAAGGSAGGHVAAATAIAGAPDDPADDLTISCRPDALVLSNPVLGGEVGGFGAAFFAAHPDCAPLRHVAPGWPPTVLSCGTVDRTTPFAQAELFQRRMAAAGNACELIPIVGADHSCDWPVANPHFRPTMARMAAFLRAHGLLDPSPPTRP